MEILFLCTGNTCRSPIACVISQKLFKEANLIAKISSAGLFADIGSPPAENAVLSISEIGLDLSSHRSQQVSKQQLEDASLILTMTKSHKNQVLSMDVDMQCELDGKVYTLAEFGGETHQDIPDPYLQDLNAYNNCRDQIEILIKKIIKERLNDSDWK